jgi:protein required for attachment to host cells
LTGVKMTARFMEFHTARHDLLEHYMKKLAVPHDAWVFVGDGRRALFLRNEGDETFPNLRTERVFLDDNAPTHVQGSDQPGRAFAGRGTPRRSSMETTDWHDIEEHRFTRAVAAALENAVRTRNINALVIVAPPRTLAELRRALHDDVKRRIIAEIDKDLTKEPIPGIERHLA